MEAIRPRVRDRFPYPIAYPYTLIFAGSGPTGEPLSWADLFAARGRALCASLRKGADAPIRDELARVRTALAAAGMTAFLPAIDVAMAT